MTALPAPTAYAKRPRMYARFLESAAVSERDSILDVGVTSDRSYTSSNYLEAWHPRKDRITAAGIDDARVLQHLELLGRARERVLAEATRSFATVPAALEAARREAGANDRIVVFGSFYTVAGVMAARKSSSH